MCLELLPGTNEEEYFRYSELGILQPYVQPSKGLEGRGAKSVVEMLRPRPGAGLPHSKLRTKRIVACTFCREKKIRCEWHG